ncbi:hypothetical protein SOVF_121270 [Spinacia oleracea]|nr:hypothetical protein SOVF_121270 [Spinacia oleracea]
MAISLSNTSTSFLCAPFSVSGVKRPSKSHKPLTLPVQSSPRNKNLNLATNSLSSSLLLQNRHCYDDFRCCFSFQEEQDSTTTMDEEMLEEEVGETEEETSTKNMWESVETLTKYYKEAVLAGDYQTITEIETAFYRLETEKNELVEKLSTLTEEITSGKDRFIRLQADFDNFRRRSGKERLSVRSDAQGELKPETDKEKQIDTSYQGIYKQFVEIMRSLRVAVVATVGKPFDPSLHEAIAREESEEFKEGIVTQEFRRGFLLGDRLLRPAMVKVSSGPGKKKKDDAAATQISPEQPAAAAAVDGH